MPTPILKTNAVPVFLLLVGAAGLVGSGVGTLPGVPGWAWVAVLALGALLPLAATRAEVRAFDQEERDRNERARKNMRIAARYARKATRKLVKRQAAVEETVAKSLSPEEAVEARTTLVHFARDLQLVKEELVRLKASENARKFGPVMRGESGDT